MPRVLPSICFLFAALLNGGAAEVVWPLPQPPDNIPSAQFPMPQGDTNFLEHIRQARSQRTDLILDGDSITDYWQSTGRAVFDKVFASRHAIDFGMSGNGTQNIIWRVQHGELDTLHPKLAMLLIGVNNSGSPVPDVAAGVTKCVQLYREKCPDMHILLLGIFPHGKLPTDRMRDITRQTNAIIAKLDDGTHVTFVDVGDKFLQPDGTISPDVMPDALHPGPKGYEIWASAVQPYLNKYCPVDPTPPPTVPALTTAQIAAAVPPQTFPITTQPPKGTSFTVFPAYINGWVPLFQRNLDQLKNGPYDLIFDGDTILMNMPGAANALMHSRYGSIKSLDLAMYAERVSNDLWRVQHGALEGQNPKLIVLNIGSSQTGEDIKEMAGGVRILLNEYKKRCPSSHIVLLGVLPHSPNDDANTHAWNQQLNTAYAALADDRVTFVDAGEKLTAEALGERLTEKGYGILADAMQPVFDKYLPNAAAKP